MVRILWLIIVGRRVNVFKLNNFDDWLIFFLLILITWLFIQIAAKLISILLFLFCLFYASFFNKSICFGLSHDHFLISKTHCFLIVFCLRFSYTHLFRARFNCLTTYFPWNLEAFCLRFLRSHVNGSQLLGNLDHLRCFLLIIIFKFHIKILPNVLSRSILVTWGKSNVLNM